MRRALRTWSTYRFHLRYGPARSTSGRSSHQGRALAGGPSPTRGGHGTSSHPIRLHPVSSGYVRGVPCDAGGGYPLVDVILRREPKMLARRHVAEEIGPVEGGEASPDSRRHVVVTGSHVGDQGSQHVQGG